LIRAALALIAQKGSAGVTFAEAARWAGVSPAAPYRHFREGIPSLFGRGDAASRAMPMSAEGLLEAAVLIYSILRSLGLSVAPAGTRRTV
jgi:AcrR family transcriptional regulator